MIFRIILAGIVGGYFVGCSTKVYQEPLNVDVATVAFTDVDGQNNVFIVPLIENKEKNPVLVDFSRNPQNKVKVEVSKPVIFIYRYENFFKKCGFKFKLKPRKNVSYLSVMHQNEELCFFHLEGYIDGLQVDVSSHFVRLDYEI